MNEPGELEKLNAVAIAGVKRGNFRIGVLCSLFLILWTLVLLRFDRVFSSPQYKWGLIALVTWAFLAEAYRAMATAKKLALGKRPECERERKQVAQWLTQLQSGAKLSGVIQFSANAQNIGRPFLVVLMNEDWLRRVLIRLLVDGQWVVVACFEDEDLSKAPELTIFDSHISRVSYLPEQKRLQIGNRRFRMVDFTPELTVLASQLAQNNGSSLTGIKEFS